MALPNKAAAIISIHLPSYDITALSVLVVVHFVPVLVFLNVGTVLGNEH